MKALFTLIQKYLDLRYVSEDDEGQKAGELLTADGLVEIPSALLLRLEEATDRSSMKQLAVVLEEIRPYSSISVAGALTRYRKTFNMSHIFSNKCAFWVDRIIASDKKKRYWQDEGFVKVFLNLF